MVEAISPSIKIVVLDDDPTGIQTIHSCYLLTRWDPGLLKEAMADSCPFFYILTNTRAYEAEKVRQIISSAVRNVLRVNRNFNHQLIFISRSDSTLRSHFPLEIDTIQEIHRRETGTSFNALFLCPAFFEAGRVTVDDTHYLEAGGRRIPTAETEFAKDSVFGYSSSHLPSYIEEKTAGRIRGQRVLSLPLDLLRDPDTEPLKRFLEGLESQTYVVVNAEKYDDLYRFARALFEVAVLGKQFLFQSAASLVKALARLPDKSLLGPEIRELPGSGIVTVGSYVEKSTGQLKALLNHPGVQSREIDVHVVLDSADKELARLLPFFRTCQAEGKTPVVYTPRKELRFSSKEERLKAGQKISSFLARLVRELPYLPSFVIAKGGITAHVVMVEGLEVAKARVLGQILPGIPVISVPRGSEGKSVPYVIFPGNVGDEQSLLEIFTKLSASH